jgi:PleD family two-component response regulator
MLAHILLIDDDEDEYEIFTTALREIAGQRCSYAPSATEAMSMIKDDRPDLIFLDINMPGIDGLKCLAGIRNTKECSDIPVVIYSTSENESMREAAFNLGASDCVKKPGRISQLEIIIRNAMAKFLSL